MDVNGTRLHLLLGEADWPLPEDRQGVAYDTGRDELTLEPLQFAFPPPARETPIGQDARRGAARDAHGSWYEVAADRTGLLVTSAGSRETTDLWPVPEPDDSAYGGFGDLPAPPTARRPLGGLAVTDDAYLVVASPTPPTLLVFDLVGGGAPEVRSWPGGSLDPHDVAARPGGGVVVLDRQARGYWELDRALRVVDRDPQPRQPGAFVRLDGSTPEDLTTGPLTTASAVAIDGDPVAVDCCADQTVVVLLDDAAGSSVRAYRDGVALGPAVPLRTGGTDGTPVHALDLAVLPSDVPGTGALGRIVVSDRFGDQCYAFDLRLEDGGPVVTPRLSYLPMRRHQGKALVAADGQVWYDSGSAWVPLAEHPRRRYQVSGTYETIVLDSGEAACVWHRLMLDAHLPPETVVDVDSFATDDPAGEPEPPWRPEPRPYVRGTGSELPFQGDTGYQTMELAFQGAVGRYLRLRLRLSGNGRSSPRIRALRAYYPRFSYLEHYLPAVYRADGPSAAFLDRWLANLEGTATDIEGRIAAAHLLFDPRTAPTEALEWLASWFELALDPAWSPARRRLLLGNAMRFFSLRGTIAGVRMALALVDEGSDDAAFLDLNSRCGQRIRVVELFRTKVTPSVALGDPTEQAPAPGLAGAWWSPSSGAQALHDAYAASLGAAGLSPQADGRFPVLAPADPDAVPVWEATAAAALGFIPAAVDPQLWRDFVARRYAGHPGLRQVYDITGPEDLAALQPPTRLPDDGLALRDWFQVQAVVLKARRTAHRFRILLPVSLDTSTPDLVGTREAQLRLARRIVELEKPAHTTFDVRFYWDAFRVGEARLAEDTLVDLGSRSPLLLRPTALDQVHLGENVLPRPHPDRRTLAIDSTHERRCP